MLFRLRHWTVVGSDHQDRGVDSAGACQHVADESLVTGNIDEMYVISGRRGELGKSQIDRHLAELFFSKSIGIGAGQNPDERRLTVIDMTGGANDEGRRAHTAKSLTSILMCPVDRGWRLGIRPQPGLFAGLCLPNAIE